MRTLQAVIVRCKQWISDSLFRLHLWPSLQQFLRLLLVQVEFGSNRFRIAAVKTVLGKLLLLRQPDVAVRLIFRPAQVVHAFDSLKKSADTLEPIRQLNRNGIEV